jgi:DNA modification methylase
MLMMLMTTVMQKHGCRQKGRASVQAEASPALNAVCPYYTMFPLEFPVSVLKRVGIPRLRVLDPFCGRGTTIFAARLNGHRAYGIDSSPIATAIAHAKLSLATEDDVVALAEALIEKRTSPSIPKGEFWRWAYAASTLEQICSLREGLRPLRSETACILRAVCLGALHGPLTKSVETRSYFSNQMPRTFASKPEYSVRYWQAQELRPVPVDVLRIIRNRVARLELDTLPRPRGKSRVHTADARLADGYAFVPSKVDLVITSPPYYGMRTYIADQWLRNWFLGGPPTVPYREQSLLSHQSPDDFAFSLSEVWDQVGKRLAPAGRMYVRFGAIPSRNRDAKQIMKDSLEYSEFDWEIVKMRRAESAASGKRQACHMGRRIKSAAIQEHDYEVSLC